MWPTVLVRCKIFLTHIISYFWGHMNLTSSNNNIPTFGNELPIFDLKMELDLAMIVPFFARPGSIKNVSESDMELPICTVAADGSAILRSVIPVMRDVAVGPRMQDTIVALITVAAEQTEEEKEPYFKVFPELRGQFVAFYTHFEICRILGLDPKSNSTHIKNMIQEIAKIKFIQKDFAFSVRTKDKVYKKSEYYIITKIGQYQKGKSDVDSHDFRYINYIVFDQDVAKSIKDNRVSTIKNERYLQADIGIERKMVLFLSAKQKIWGNSYMFKLDEIAHVSGFSGKAPHKKRESVKKHMDSLQKKLHWFSYRIELDKAKKTHFVFVEHFDSAGALEKSSGDPFFNELIEYYTLEKMHETDFQEEDLYLSRKELNGKYFQSTSRDRHITALGEEVDPVEYAIDIALYQVIKCGGEVQKGMRRLVAAIHASLIDNSEKLPGNYRYFVKKRNEIKREEAAKLRYAQLKERTEREDKELAENLKKGFDALWFDLINKNKTGYTAFLKLAETDLREELVGNNEDPTSLDRDPAKNVRILKRAESLAFELYRKNQFMDFLEKHVNEYKKLGKAKNVIGPEEGETEQPLLIQ